MKSRFLFAGAALAMLAVPLASSALLAQAAATAAAPAIGAWGVDLSGGDTAVKPGDDWFRFTAGHWFDTTTIPSDRPSTGTFYDLRDHTTDQLKLLLTSAPATSKYGALYTSFMNEAQLETVGLAPLKRDLAGIAGIRTKAQFARYMGQTNGRFGSTVVDFG